MDNPLQWSLEDWMTRVPIEFWLYIAGAFFGLVGASFKYGRYCGKIEEKRATIELNHELQKIKGEHIKNSQFSESESLKPIQLPEGGPSFTQDPYINPAIIQELAGWISDGSPVIKSIDLEGAMTSNRYVGEVSEKNGAVTFAPQNWNNEAPSSFGYQYLGCSSAGIHALLTTYWGGGSGIFYEIVFVCFVEDALVKEVDSKLKKTKRIMINYLGNICLGDRPILDGVSLESNTLKIGKISFLHGEEGKPARKIRM